MTVKEYVEINLSAEFQIVKSRINDATVSIDIYQQTIIYYYSADGYKELNAFLREAPNKFLSEFGQLLSQTLANLPPFAGVVYRSVNLTPDELNRYSREGETISESFFVSTSKSKLKAEKHGTTLFRIISKSGHDIGDFSRHRSEEEVLFAAGTTFKVQKVRRQYDGKLVIMLEEIH